MKTRNCILSVLALIVALTLAATPLAAAPLGTGFTYQGQLKENGAPIDGTAHLRFSLWDAAGIGSPPVGGSQIGVSQLLANVVVANGLFTVLLNAGGQFGANAFNGEARWLQVEVCADAGCGTLTILAPRQPLTAAPHAVYSLKASWSGLSDVPAGFADGVDDAGGLPLPFSGSFSGSDTNAFSIAQTGTGRAGQFVINNPASFWEALTVASNGTGPGLFVTHSGSGSCGQFQNLNASNPAPAVRATTDAVTGVAISATASNGYGLSASGGVQGVRGHTSSPNGFAGYFTGPAGSLNYFERNVGIGTTSPDNTLHVLKASAGVVTGYANAPLVVENSTHAYINLLTPDANERGMLFGSPTAGATAGGIIYNSASTPEGLQFRTGGNVNRMAIDSTGNVGIGTTTPDAKLHVEGASNTLPSGGGLLVMGSTTSNNISIDNNEIMARNNGAVATLALNDSGGNVTLIENGSGNVGIGTASPARKLDVNGTTRTDSLEVNYGGAIRVLGAGVGTDTAVFIHVVPAADDDAHATDLDHPLLNGNPNAIVFVMSARYTSYVPLPCAARYVYYFGSKWTIATFDDDSASGCYMHAGDRFNVLVILP